MRRSVRVWGGTGTILALAPISFAAAATGSKTQVVDGQIAPGPTDFVYLPVNVPRGVQQISVVYSYSKPAVPAGTPGNACDIGIFDARGFDFSGSGFRGWSGGFRTEFSISRTEATPGYVPGDVMPGT